MGRPCGHSVSTLGGLECFDVARGLPQGRGGGVPGDGGRAATRPPLGEGVRGAGPWPVFCRA
eukprot:4138457-Lingulodinium_polyedra.AAC.1